jgi:uncharacterized protein (TIGR02391 family)
MRAAIPRLKTRIAELRAVNVEGISDRYDPTLSALKQKVVSTLTDILGAGTVEYQQVGSIRLDEASMNIMHATPLHEVREGYSQGIARTIGKLQTLIDLFEEKLGASADDSAARARRAFGDLDLHPEVARSVGRLFEHGHYANAVEDACKILDGLVKLRSGRSDKSGTELMLGVFSPKKPVLKFNDLQTESDKSEQQGMMYLYAGAMLALRNPRAHGLLRDDAESALEYIAFVNLLAKTLDRAQRA